MLIAYSLQLTALLLLCPAVIYPEPLEVADGEEFGGVVGVVGVDGGDGLVGGAFVEAGERPGEGFFV